ATPGAAARAAAAVSPAPTVADPFVAALDPSPVTGSASQVPDPVALLVALPVCASASQITLTPSAALAGSTTYTATITGGASGVTAVAATALAGALVWPVTPVAVDVSAPNDASRTPAGDATAVSTAAAVVANCSA